MIRSPSRRSVRGRLRRPASLLGVALLGVLLGSCTRIRPATTRLFGAARTHATLLAPGDIAVPDGRSIRFDLTAGPDLWVITHLDGEPVDREVTA